VEESAAQLSLYPKLDGPKNDDGLRGKRPPISALQDAQPNTSVGIRQPTTPIRYSMRNSSGE